MPSEKELQVQGPTAPTQRAARRVRLRDGRQTKTLPEKRAADGSGPERAEERVAQTAGATERRAADGSGPEQNGLHESGSRERTGRNADRRRNGTAGGGRERSGTD